MTTIEKRANDAVASMEYAATIADLFIDPSQIASISTKKGAIKSLSKIVSDADVSISKIINDVDIEVSRFSHFKESVFISGSTYVEKIFFIDSGTAYTPMVYPYVAGSDVATDNAAGRLTVLQGLTLDIIGSALDQLPTNRDIDSVVKHFESLADAVAVVSLDSTRFNRIRTDSRLSRVECEEVGKVFPDQGGADYLAVHSIDEIEDGDSVIGVGLSQLKLVISKLTNVNQFSSYENYIKFLLKNQVVSRALNLDSPYRRYFEKVPSMFDISGVVNGDIWQHNNHIYTANRTRVGDQTSWIRDRNGYVPISLEQGSMLGAWWLKRVVPSYSGPCINVTNVQLGSSIDIGFNIDGSLNVDLLAEYIGSSKGLVNIWYDQSGAANNLTSAGINRPVITLENVIGSSPAVLFESGVIYNGTQSPAQYMTIPNSVVTTSNSVSILMLSKFASTIRTVPLCTLNGSSYTALGYKDQSGIDCVAGYANDSVRKIGDYQPSVEAEFLYLSSSASEFLVGVGQSEVSSYSPVSGVSLAGGKLGKSDSPLFNNGAGEPVSGGSMCGGLTIYDDGKPIGVIRELNKSIARLFDLKPQVRGSVIFEGDSITEGAYQTFFNNWPRVASDLLPNRFRSYNVARSGGTTLSQYDARENWMGKIYDSAADVNIVIVCLGTNDLGAGSASGVTYGNLKRYTDSLKFAGFSVIVGTVLPRNSFVGSSKETERLNYNELIRSGWEADLGVLGVIDLANEKTMGDVAKASSAAYYQDGTHLSDFGASLVASYVAEYLSTIF